MARELNRLTPLFIKNAKPEPDAKGTKLFADGGGLYLQVTATAAKAFVFRYTLDGVSKSMGLGPVHTTTLAEARDEALASRKLLRAGKDPKSERERLHHAHSVARDLTFRAVAQEFIKGLKKGHRSAKAHAQWGSSMETYVYPIIGAVPIADVDVHMIREILTRDGRWEQKTETMRRVRGRVERILGAAAVYGWRSAENPARYTNYLSEVLPSLKSVRKVVHHPSLPYPLMPAFMKMLREQPLSMSNLALELLILTATRTGEVIGATWQEIDFDAKVWTIPAERMKAARAHRVPLSDAALTVLEKARTIRQLSFVFPGAKYGKHLSNMSMLQAMRGFTERKLLDVPAVPHGCRSSFRSWCAAATTFPRDVAESALAHTLSAVEKAYQRDDQLERRRELMESWATFCGSLT